MSKDDWLLTGLVQWLRQQAAEQPGRFVFLTLTFDRYRRFAYTVACDARFAPNRAEVVNGLTRPMPVADARAALTRDLDLYYCFVLRALIGKRYGRHLALQPLAVGAIDEPRYKHASKRSAVARKPGDRFDHAHFVMFLPEVQVRGRSLIERFVELAKAGSLQELWRKLNRTGEFHVTDVFDLAVAVDYTFKSAKLTASMTDELLLWPAALPTRQRG